MAKKTSQNELGTLKAQVKGLQALLDQALAKVERLEHALAAKPLEGRLAIDLGDTGAFELTVPGRGEGYRLNVAEAHLATTLRHIFLARIERGPGGPGTPQSPTQAMVDAWAGRVKRFDLKGNVIFDMDGIDL